MRREGVEGGRMQSVWGHVGVGGTWFRRDGVTTIFFLGGMGLREQGDRETGRLFREWGYMILGGIWGKGIQFRNNLWVVGSTRLGTG
jgi:hypothetical protein